jgi:hypothetical protein
MTIYSTIPTTDTVCDEDWGYGLSSGIMGSMKNLNDDAFQDAFMVAHEIGHSLGSGKRENRSSNSSSF